MKDLTDGLVDVRVHPLRRVYAWLLFLGALTILLSWTWPKVVAIYRTMSNVVWLDEHRQEFPKVMDDYSAFKNDSLRDRAEIHRLLETLARSQSELAGEVRKVNLNVAAYGTIASANQDLQFQILTLMRSERGLAPPKRPAKPVQALTPADTVPPFGGQ